MTFEAQLEARDGEATIKLEGDLDSSSVSTFRERLDEVARDDVERLVLDMRDLRYLSSAGLRGLVFARQKMGRDIEIVILGATDLVAETIRLTGFDRSVTMCLTRDGD